jgi:hypothetical protein
MAAHHPTIRTNDSFERVIASPRRGRSNSGPIIYSKEIHHILNMKQIIAGSTSINVSAGLLRSARNDGCLHSPCVEQFDGW